MLKQKNNCACTNKETIKFKNIEFLRVVAIVAIIFLHVFHNNMGMRPLNLQIPLYDKLDWMVANGQKGVDFFFILSGLFFYFGIAADNFSVAWSNFLKKKIIRMWPIMVFGVLISGILASFGLLKFTYWDNIYALLFLNGTALHRVGGNIGVAWYCSAMLMHFILFLYLFKNFREKTVWLIIAVGVYVCYSIILQAKGYKINHNWQTFGYIFNVGMMRAWGGIGFGMLIGLWYKTNVEKIKQFVPSILCKLGISVLEFVCLYFMINNLILHRFHHFDHFMFIIVFVYLVTAFICNKGYISQLFNRDIFPRLSQYVYSIFIMHQVVVTALKRGLWTPHREWVQTYPITNIFLTLALILVVGVLTYHLVEKPAAKYLRKKWFNK